MYADSIQYVGRITGHTSSLSAVLWLKNEHEIGSKILGNRYFRFLCSRIIRPVINSV